MESYLMILTPAKKLRKELLNLINLERKGLIKKDEWDLYSCNLEEIIKEDPLLTDSIDEIFWHYLSDFDMRSKYPDYFRDQINGVLEICDELKNM